MGQAVSLGGPRVTTGEPVSLRGEQNIKPGQGLVDQEQLGWKLRAWLGPQAHPGLLRTGHWPCAAWVRRLCVQVSGQVVVLRSVKAE